MNNMDELLQKKFDAAVGIENPAENTATAVRDKMQSEIAIAIGKVFDDGMAKGKTLTIDYILNMFHVFADNLENKHDAEIVTECIKLVEMMKGN